MFLEFYNFPDQLGRRPQAGRSQPVVDMARHLQLRGKNGFLIVEGCNAAYFSTLTPVELIELGTELVVAGTGAIREHRE